MKITCYYDSIANMGYIYLTPPTEDQEDAYVIVQLEDAKKLGIHYFHNDDEYPIALFKGLLSARDDIYPLEYLLNPQFVIQRDSVFDENL
jgi:hypothetical protein